MLMAAAKSNLDRLDEISRTRALSHSEVRSLERAVRRFTPKRERWYWTRTDDKRLTGYIKRGKKPKQIAILMKRTERAVWQRMVRLKLRVREFEKRATVQSPLAVDRGKD